MSCSHILEKSIIWEKSITVRGPALQEGNFKAVQWKGWDTYICTMGFPGGPSDKDPACQSRRHKRHGFDPWVGKIPLEKGMATHSSTLAWRIPWTEEPGALYPSGSQRVGHDWMTNTFAFPASKAARENVFPGLLTHCLAWPIERFSLDTGLRKY